MLKPKDTIKIQNIDFNEYTDIIDFEDLTQLETVAEEDEAIFETEDASYILRPRVAFRVLKPQAKPHILKSLKFEASPDAFSCKVELEYEELLTLALKRRLPVFENLETNELLLPSEIFLYAKKKK